MIELAPHLVATLGTLLAADLCELWLAAPDGLLHCAGLRSADDLPGAEQLEERTRSLAFAPGEGLPGRVWRDDRAVWIEDPAHADGFVRREEVERCGLRSGLGVPFHVEGGGDGVLCIFDRHPRSRSERLPETIQLAASASGRVLVCERQARGAERRKDEFLALLGHELRNPLAALSHGLDLLARRAPGIETGLHRMMDRQLGQLRRLLDELLDLTRMTRGTIRLERRPVHLPELLRNAVQAVQPTLDRRRHRLVLDFPEEPVGIEADAARLQQTVVSLVENAALYTEPGGGSRLRLSVANGGVVIEVEDTGRGIAAEDRERIFEPFAQVREDGELSEGLGLGLALARHVVELHGGSLTVESAGAGRGSTFRVVLPRLVLPGAAAPPEAPSPPGSVTGRKILLIEDNPDSALALAEILELHGAHVETARDAASGLEVLERTQPDVVLLDLGLPDRSGHELVDELNDNGGSRPPVVVISGYGNEETRRRCREQGCEAFLVKPVDIRQLLEVVAEVA